MDFNNNKIKIKKKGEEEEGAKLKNKVSHSSALQIFVWGRNFNIFLAHADIAVMSFASL